MLIETRARKRHVAVCCEGADAAGVRAGMSLAHARSLLTGHRIRVQPFTPDADALGLERLAEWAMRFTPVVATDQPDGLLLDMTGCEHLYGGTERLLQRIAVSFERIGIPVRLCAAPTFAGARAVARYAGKRVSLVRGPSLRALLAPLPIEALRIDPNVCASLREVGVTLIGQLLRLPRKEVVRRFSAEPLRRLDQALGVLPEHVPALAVCQPLVVTRMFDGPVVRLDIVMCVTRDLLDSLIEILEQQGRGVCDLRIEFQRVDADPVYLTFPLTHPTRDAHHLWSLIQPPAQRVSLGYGVEVIRLHATRTAPLVHRQRTLWSEPGAANTKADNAHVGKLVDQLMERLGPRAVTRCLPVETYLPERAFQRQSVAGTRSGRPGDIYLAPRPSRLFTVPEPIKVVAVVPNGPPVRLARRGQVHTVRSSLGPERVALPWWNRNDPMGARDYYEVQNECGRWLWVFRVRGTNDDQPPTGRWFVHGEWA